MSSTRRTKLTRRSFLRLSGAGLGAVAVADLLAACGTALGVDDDGKHIDVSSLAVTAWISVRRPDDLLVVDFGLVNLKRVTIDGVVHLVKRKASKPALLVAALPAQHLSEQTTDAPPATLPLEHLLADGSRLVFNVGPVVPIELSIAGLLEACTRAGLNVATGAMAPAGSPEVGGSTSGLGGARVLDPLETSLEMPTRLALSPNQSARFTHAAEPVASPRQRVELWHTRLDAPRDVRTMRALHHFAGPSPTDAIPRPWQRDDIVTISSNPANRPIQVERVALSALGAWFDASLDDELGFTSVAHWDQRVAMGRDVRVEVVTRGQLWPLPHRAPAIETVERRFSDGPDPVMYLHRKVTILCAEPVRHYHGLPASMAQQERRWPFSSIRIVTRTTPPIDGAPSPSTDLLPMVGGEPFEWLIEATDRRGETVRFSMPLIWLPLGQTSPSSAIWPEPYIKLGGQRIAFAQPAGLELDQRDATAYETRTIRIEAEPPEFPGDWDAPSYPLVRDAEIVVEALAATAGAVGAVPVRFNDAYLVHGIGNQPGNLNDLILDITGNAIKADFVKAGTDKVGGFIAPNLEVAGLSRATGPVTQAMIDDPAAAVTAVGVFPLPLGDALNAFCPRLFGCISLLDIVATAGVKPEDLVPKFVAEAFDEVQRLRQTVEALVKRATDLWTQLNNVATQVNSATTEIKQHAEALRVFFETAQDTFQDELKQARDQVEALLARDPDTVEIPEIDALDLGVLDRVQELGKLLGSDKTVKLLEHLPESGTLLRTTRRIVTGLADVAETIATVKEGIKTTLKAMIRARDIVKDKTVKLDWRPTLKPSYGGTGVELALVNTRGLLLSVELRAKQRGAQKAGADVLCSLEDFNLKLLNLIELDFKRLQFRQRMSQKPEIDVVFNGIKFIGALAFVQTLQEILPFDGFSDPPAVKVDAKGLDASFSLDIPNLAVGVFSLEQMRIGARLLVPFLGDAISFRFEFSRREAPFLVTVAMLGGGGFFELELTPKGMKSLVASVQFGAQLSASIGVASGSISFMGGFVYEMSASSVSLTGFLRMRGECDVLGLVSASIELYLDLKYDGCNLTGTATLCIEISVAFFTLPIKLTATETFAGANGDPPFAEMVSSDDFNEYCHAFAA